MSFLKKLFKLGGCSRLYKESVETSFITNDDDEDDDDPCLECLEPDSILIDLQYIPWSSPGH